VLLLAVGQITRANWRDFEADVRVVRLAKRVLRPRYRELLVRWIAKHDR
jgi:hypothetical protein